jgi:hypothetical protein
MKGFGLGVWNPIPPPLLLLVGQERSIFQVGDELRQDSRIGETGDTPSSKEVR